MDIKDNNTDKSEEVQAIIDRMPTYWVKWVVLCVSCLMGLVVVLSTVIKYPDTVDGQVSITGSTAPIRVVANTSGRIILIKENKSIIRKGDVISYIENGTDYNHVLWTDSVINTLKESEYDKIIFPDTLILGEISSSYNSFMVSFAQYMRLQESGLYRNMRNNLLQQIKSDELVIENLKTEYAIKNKIVESSFEQLQKDSILFQAKGISEQEYRQKKSNHLSLHESLISLHSSILLKRSEINKNKIEIDRVSLEENEILEKAYSDMMARKNELSNALNLWKERYLQSAALSGELEYLGFWRDNSFVKASEELFSVIPDKNNILGEVMIPSFGAGKVEEGQSVNIKINNYPYDEYGLLKGEVQSISRITNKLATQNGEVDAYLVVISLPDGTRTNFGKTIPLDFETKGSAEIITKRKRLIQRLFDNLKAKGEK